MSDLVTSFFTLAKPSDFLAPLKPSDLLVLLLRPYTEAFLSRDPEALPEFACYSALGGRFLKQGCVPGAMKAGFLGFSTTFSLTSDSATDYSTDASLITLLSLILSSSSSSFMMSSAFSKNKSASGCPL